MRSRILIAGISLVLGGQLSASDLATFEACIGWLGQGPVCQLDPNPAPGSNGVWTVDHTLQIGRSNITIQGTLGNSADVILKRGPAALDPIMGMEGQQTNVTIQYLTFDGNRWNTIPCGTSQAVTDLDLSFAGWAIVRYVNFINAPSNALKLGTLSPTETEASVVEYSNFGMGFVSPARGYNLSGPQTAARFTAVYLLGEQTGAWNNNISYSGTAAISSFTGSHHYIVGNAIQGNRYEISDGTGGGQLYIPTSYATVAGNLINGDYWRTTGTPVNGCSTSGHIQPYPNGIEAYGTGNRYFNNRIIQHLAWGMLLRTSSNTLISTENPWSPGSPRQYIQDNGGCVIYSCYSGFPPSMAMAQILVSNAEGAVTDYTFDKVYVRHSNAFGIYLYGLQGSPGFVPSGQDNACLYNNIRGNFLATGGTAAIYNSTFDLMPTPCPTY